MVGILKGLHSDASTETNTKAFSVLIAFAGGVWREFGNILKDRHIAHRPPVMYSALCNPMVLARTAPHGFVLAAGYDIVDRRIQADLCRFSRMHEAEADIPISGLLFSHVCRIPPVWRKRH